MKYFQINHIPHLIINLLLNSEEELCLFFLEKLNVYELNEADFFNKDKTTKFVLFKAFVDNCNNLLEKYGNINGTYPNKIFIFQNKIFNFLQNGGINYDKLKSFILEDYEFKNKIKLITSNEFEAQKLCDKLKHDFLKCKKYFNDIEIILDYYSTFYPNSKEELIKLIKEKRKEYKEQKSIHDFINMDITNFFDIKNFHLKKAVEESRTIKYKTSSFFMLLYEIHYEKDKLDKSEYKILEETINDYINTFQEIIERLESKRSLFDINNIELIVKKALNPEFDLGKEMYFINREFSCLNKREYPLHNLKNDFLFFIEQFQFMHLIQGIINFIEYNYKTNEKKETNCFNNFRIIYNSIIENKINEENINEFINKLKANEYYFNNENILIQFYKTLLEKKETLSFLNKMKDSIININNLEKPFLNSNEIINLINIYVFFKNIIKNKEIKSDKDFIYLYNKEIEKNNKILINFGELIKKYFNFVKGKSEKVLENQINEILDNANNNGINQNPFIIQFNYNSELITIQGNLNEKVKDIINKFVTKTNTDKNSLCFLYGGSIIKEQSLLSQIATREDKRRNQMNILVNSFLDNKQNETNSIIKSKEVICPKCLEEIKLKIKNYKISLYECKNGHGISDIYFKDFLNTQNIDLKKIICNNCNLRNKHDSFDKKFFTCFTCGINLCPLCQSNHDNSHYIIDYDKRNSICKKHFESYYSYCKNCKINLCIKCEKAHSNHEKINYENILPDSNEIN